MRQQTNMEEMNRIHDEKGFKFRCGTWGYKNQHGAGGCAVGALLYGRLGLVGNYHDPAHFAQLLGLDQDYIDALDEGFEQAAFILRTEAESIEDFGDLLRGMCPGRTTFWGGRDPEDRAYQMGAEIAYTYRDELN